VARATIAGLKALQRPDEVARSARHPRRQLRPKGLLNAYNERQKQMAAGAASHD
jgi:small subunit ribosomal protein S5